MKKIDLNCDLGESFGAYVIGLDEDILPHISSANVACGFHASDPAVMAKTVALAKAAGVAVGALPGYPDLQGFGRRNMAVPPKEVKAMVQYQIGALLAFCTASGVAMQHVKPHGALYNMAGKDEALAMAICEGIYEVDRDLILLGLSGALIAFFAQWGLYQLVAKLAIQGNGLSLVSIVSYSSMAPTILMVFCAVGAVIGVGGSLVAIRKFLQV